MKTLKDFMVEFTVPGFEGKRIKVTKKPIRMIDGKMAKRFLEEELRAMDQMAQLMETVAVMVVANNGFP